jgi:uncharacterized membrane protein HdeD (DUF308 family)
MSMLRRIARHRWLFWLHAALMLVLAFLLLILHFLMRNLLIGTFAGIFVLMITGFSLVLIGLVNWGAALEAFLDKEATAWLFVILGTAGVFLGIFLFVSPTISVDRLCFFVAIHALALGFLEMRLAQRLRCHKRQQDSLRSFASVSTIFVVLLLMAALYGEHFGILILSAYCVFFALELALLPAKLDGVEKQPGTEAVG